MSSPAGSVTAREKGVGSKRARSPQSDRSSTSPLSDGRVRVVCPKQQQRLNESNNLLVESNDRLKESEGEEAEEVGLQAGLDYVADCYDESSPQIPSQYPVADASDAGSVQMPMPIQRKKIKIEYVKERSRRHITFSKRKAGIMKKAYELATLTGTEVLLVVASESGHVYSYASEKFESFLNSSRGKDAIQACLAREPCALLDSDGHDVPTKRPTINSMSPSYDVLPTQLKPSQSLPTYLTPDAVNEFGFGLAGSNGGEDLASFSSPQNLSLHPLPSPPTSNQLAYQSMANASGSHNHNQNTMAHMLQPSLPSGITMKPRTYSKFDLQDERARLPYIADHYQYQRPAQHRHQYTSGKSVSEDSCGFLPLPSSD